MCRTDESKIGSYAGRMAPPGMPNMTSTPSDSSDRTRDCAPVTDSVTTRTGPVDGAGCCGPCPCALTPAATVSGEGAEPDWERVAPGGEAESDGDLLMAFHAFGSA